MHNNYKVVACVPAGRERTLSLLLAHLRSQRGVLDAVHLWENTTNNSDLNYIKSQEDDFVIVINQQGERRKPIQRNTGKFYKNCIQKDTIYIRFDDDIVWLHPNAIKNLVDCRIENPKPFVIFANIINNAICTYYLAKYNKLNLNSKWSFTKHCVDDYGWANKTVAEYLHRSLLSKINEVDTEHFYTPNIVLDDYTRFSVSCIVWKGEDFAEFDGDLSLDWERYRQNMIKRGKREYSNANLAFFEEERYISECRPQELSRPNMICGNGLISHFSFFPQREHLLKTDILDQYKLIAQNVLHDAYYDMLGNQEIT